jgi:oxygen-dependent protoporphyrinogen oxidase
VTGGRFVVVGGGIAGLAAAWEASGRVGGEQVVVVEATDRFGGKLWTEELLGHPVDRGADAFLVRTPDALDLCHELGLQDELVNPAERSALLWSDGRLHRFPEGLVLGVPTDLDALADSGIVSPEGVERARHDLDEPGEPPDGDTTVGALVRERLGDEVFEKLVGPLLSGINAGHADELSLEAGAAQLAAAARAGSLIRGARAQRAAGDPEAPVFASLRGGTGRLVERLVAALTERGVDLRAGAAAASIATGPDGAARWRVELAEAAIDASSVVLACPAPVVDQLLPAAAGRADAPLEYASVAVVTLAYPRNAVAHALDASGVLVPEPEGMLLTACSFGSAKWPHWSDGDVALFRASVGRFHDARHLGMDDGRLVRHLHNELAPMLGISATPLATAVTRWPDALPQYRPGHLDRVDAAAAALTAACPGVVVAGASTRGVGIPACIRSGRDAAVRALAE